MKGERGRGEREIPFGCVCLGGELQIDGVADFAAVAAAGVGLGLGFGGHGVLLDVATVRMNVQRLLAVDLMSCFIRQSRTPCRGRAP